MAMTTHIVMITATATAKINMKLTLIRPRGDTHARGHHTNPRTNTLAENTQPMALARRHRCSTTRVILLSETPGAAQEQQMSML